MTTAGATTTDLPQQHRLRLLIVDDNFALRDSLTQLFLTSGAAREVRAVASCEEAQDAMAGGQFDVVLLDIKLPDGSGLQLLRELQRESPETALLMHSSNDEAHVVASSYHAGASGFVSKGTNLGRLLGDVAQAAAECGRNSRCGKSATQHTRRGCPYLTRCRRLRTGYPRPRAGGFHRCCPATESSRRVFTP